MTAEFKGKTALITGAARGIGRAIADRLAANGARVIFTDRDGPGADAAARSASLSAAAPHLAYALDVADRVGLEKTLRGAIADAGRIDILINNAGIGVKAADRQTVDAFPVEAWDDMIAIDLTGVFLMSRAIAAHMKAKGGGNIVSIASVLGLVPMRLQSSYVAAKAGVVNLTRAMAIELGKDNILVNAVAPGSTATDGWRKWIGDARSEELDLHARLMSHIPLGRPAEPDEIARGVAFLASPANTYITGQILSIDGGWTAGFARDF